MSPSSPHLRTRWAIAAQVLVLVLVLAVLVWPRLERYFLLQATEQNRVTLSLAGDGLRAALDRYAPMPHLIAERPALRQLLADPSDAALAAEISNELLNTALAVSASDVYLMDKTGQALAASSYRRRQTLVGRNFSYRPYFTQAMAGRLGRYFALGTTSGERGYFFAAPVRDGPAMLGVVAVSFTVEAFEERWRDAASDIFVSDNNGVVFMASRPDWHFRTLETLGPVALRRIEENGQYPIDRIRPLNPVVEPLAEDTDLMLVEGTEYIASSQEIVEAAGWRVTSLVPSAPARLQALQALAILALLGLIGIFAAAFLRHRSAQQGKVKRMLEARVGERTAALRHEIEERRAAEEELRRTQASLVQAGKLSALGQMSAALSHEFNQPLAAVKSYAENAVTFLDRGRNDAARENIQRISRLADRMASISKHLRNFARRPQEAVGPVPLLPVIEDAIAVTEPRLRSAGITLVTDLPTGQPVVAGGHVRLQQVIVNLVTNAADVTSRGGEIVLAVAPGDHGWRVTLRDHGPGLPDGAAGQIFDPFFTTKPMGEGLGLGLSISFNIVRDFGGTLWGRNHPGGGAIFGVDLRDAAAGQSEAAE